MYIRNVINTCMLKPLIIIRTFYLLVLPITDCQRKDTAIVHLSGVGDPGNMTAYTSMEMTSRAAIPALWYLLVGRGNPFFLTGT